MIRYGLQEINYKMIIIDKIDYKKNYEVNTIYTNKDLEKSELEIEVYLNKGEGLTLKIKNIKIKDKLKEGNDISASIVGLINGHGIGFSLTGLKILEIDENNILAFTNLKDNFSRYYYY